VPFGSRLVFLLLTIGIAWFFNSEKNRYHEMQAKAYEDKNDREIGKYGEKISFYSNALGLMFFVILIMFIFLLGGEF
jgi:uncharacterized membrane protein